MTLLITIQTDYARTMNMGYDNEHKLSVQGLANTQIGDSAETVRDVVFKNIEVTGKKLADANVIQVNSFTVLEEGLEHQHKE